MTSAPALRAWSRATARPSTPAFTRTMYCPGIVLADVVPASARTAAAAARTTANVRRMTPPDVVTVAHGATSDRLFQLEPEMRQTPAHEVVERVPVLVRRLALQGRGVCVPKVT